MVTKSPDPQQHPHIQRHCENDSDLPTHPKINGVNSLDTPPASTLLSNQEEGKNNGSRGQDDDEGGGPSDYALHRDQHPNGCGNYRPSQNMPHNSNSKPPSLMSSSGHRAPQGRHEGNASPSQDSREQRENVVLRRGFVPRTAPERVAQRKSSMAQLQQWVNQRRGMASQEDINRYDQGRVGQM